MGYKVIGTFKFLCIEVQLSAREARGILIPHIYSPPRLFYLNFILRIFIKLKIWLIQTDKEYTLNLNLLLIWEPV